MQMPGASHGRRFFGARPSIYRNQRGTTALEFAILAVPFFIMVLGIFEIAYDMFMQEATDMALQAGARQMEVGNAYGTKNAYTFLQNYVCNSTAGALLECSGFHIKVQVLGQNDTFATISTGSLPGSATTLDLSSYDDNSQNSTVFCNAPPGSLILVSAVYVGPTFLGGLVPYFSKTYNNTLVHAVLSQVGVASENFSGGSATQCS